MSHAAEFDEYGHKDHGHVIMSVFTLRFVLIALLICTLLTSGSAWAEEWISQTFHVEIPVWINVCVALSIAVVKTALVVGFFMQLKYDNPMNTIIFVFTLLTVASFLGFTTMDLGNRDSIDRFKNVYAYEGGDLTAGPGSFVKEPVSGESIVARAQREGDAKSPAYGEHAEAVEQPREIGQIIQDAGYLPEKPALGSSSNLSRPVQGVTIPALPGYHAPQSASHSGGHAAPAEHKPEADTNTDTKPEAKPGAPTEAKPK